MDKKDIIETIDDDGNKVKFELLDIIDMDDKEYALLMPVDPPQNEDEDEDDEDGDEVIIMRLKKDGDDYSFEYIDNDEEFEKVSEYIEEIEDETED